MTIIEYLGKRTRIVNAAIGVALTLWVPTAGTAAPLPLTAEEISILKAGAAASKASPAVSKAISDANSLTVKLASEGQMEAFDLLLSEGSAYLLNSYSAAPIPATEIESRLRAYYDKPALAVVLLRATRSYASRETFRLLLDDLTAYADEQQHRAMYCKVVTTMPRPDEIPTAQNATLESNLGGIGISTPNSEGAVIVPGPVGQRLIIHATGREWCRDERGEWQLERSYMSPLEIQVRDRRAAALGAITRTDLPGIESDLLKLVSPLSWAMASEKRGPDPAAVTIIPRLRKVPPLGILKTLGERGGDQTIQELTALLEALVSQGPPYGITETPTFAGIVASLNTPKGSAAAQSVLVGLASSPESPARNAAMESLIKPLGEIRPPAQVDLAALKERLMPLVSASDDKARVGRAFDIAIHINAGLRQPSPDFAAELLRNNHELSGQLRYVLERIADPNLKTTKGETILNAAAGNLEAQKLLLARGADPNLPGIRGFTALHMPETAEGVRLLLAHGANVNAVATDDDRSTPLHLALARRAYDVARVLIDAGANVNAENRWGKRPLTIAVNLQHEEMQALIRKHGGTESAQDRDERMKGERFITRRYSIRTVQLDNDKRCDLGLLARAPAGAAIRICERLALRDADKIEVVSPREMRLTYFSGITLRGEKPLHVRKTEPQAFTAVVRDREVVGIEWNLQVVDLRNAGCAPTNVLLGGPACWDNTVQLCEHWGTHESDPCAMTPFGAQPTSRASGKGSPN